MTKAYGELMQALLSYRDGFVNEAEFRAFALESIRTFIQDLRAFGIEVSLRPESFTTPRRQPEPAPKAAAVSANK